MIRGWTTELALAAACCHWPPSPEGDRRVTAAAQAVTDWNHFEGIVGRNRISGLVHRALGRAGIEVPEPTASALAGRAADRAQRDLEMAREALRLQQLFDAAGVPFMIVKGVPLALLAYGSLGIKESNDIDFLVSPENAGEARRQLLELGYRSFHPRLERLDPGAFERYVAHDKEAAFVHPETGILVELHWRLIDQHGLLRGVGVDGPAQAVAVAGGSVRTLADEPLFAFLCLHGASHNWSRLKWLADVNAFLSRCASPEALYDAALTYGAGRSAAVATRLCRRLFGLDMPEALIGPLEASRITRALEANALDGLAFRGGAVEQTPYRLPTWRTKAAQVLLAPGAGHLAEQAGIFWNAPYDRARVLLPRRLSFLYHVIRVPLWLGRKAAGARDRFRPSARAPAGSARQDLPYGPE